MKSAMSLGGALLALSWAASSSPACNYCYYCAPALKYPLPVAPSLCNMPGFYVACPAPCYRGPGWNVYGPNYYLRPPGVPFNGILPGDKGKFIQAHYYGPQAVYGSQGSGPGLRGPAGPMGPGGGPMGPGMGPMGPMGPGMGPVGPMGAGMGPVGPMGAGMGPVRMEAPGLTNPFFPTPGVAPPGQPPEQPNSFTHHPYTRSPRDFFMWREMMEEKTSRELRQPLLP